MGKGADTVKHLKAKEVANFGLGKKEASHALNRARTTRPKGIKIGSSDKDLKERIHSAFGVGEPPFKTKEGTPITFKWTKEMIAWAC
jgi:hypothetical protein